MSNLRRNINRFFYRNRNKGIPNLMLYIGIGNLIVYFFSRYENGLQMYEWFRFSAEKIFQGQVWRLFTYIFTFGYSYSSSSIFGFFLMLLAIYFYYWLGKTLEATWGTLRFNLFYLSGLLLMDAAALILYACFPFKTIELPVTVTYLNLSMFLAVATLNPEQRVLFMMFIPIKMRWLGLVDLGLTLYGVIDGIYSGILYWTQYGPLFGVYFLLAACFPLVALLNYFLFLGKDVKNLLPLRWQRSRKERKTARNYRAKVVEAEVEPNPDWAKNYRSSTGARPYRHKCTVCGSTDTDYPNLDFRYCSKCKGYYCYCSDHINNHTHMQ